MLEVAGDAVLVVTAVRAHHEVLEHRHAREDATALRNLHETAPDELVGAHTAGAVGDLLAGEADLAAANRHDSRDAHQRGGLAGAVAADQRDDLALADLERHLVQHLDRAVARHEALHGEERFCASLRATHPRSSLPR